MSKPTYIKIDDSTYDAVTLDLSGASKDFREAWEVGENKVVAVNWVKARQLFRDTAVLSKASFCIALAQAGILTDLEAVEAAKGNWPAPFEAAIADLTDMEKLTVKVEWAAADNVHRNHWALPALALAAGLTEEQLDDMFGYGGQ